MNQLPLDKRIHIINLLVEGSSLRSTSRITGCSINTVTKLLVDVGKACQKFHNQKVINIKSKRVQCDEIWSFVYAKQKNVPDGMQDAGDIWTWTGIDSDSKLIISWLVGARDVSTAHIFMQDIADRIQGKVQLTTDGLRAYIDAVDDIFGVDIDYAQIVKIYGGKSNEKKSTFVKCTGIEKSIISGNPNQDNISTSCVERQNLTMRMHIRRFTRFTNAFSKKLENHCYAIALHFVYYNFCKIHKTLRVTPAMEAGIMKEVMEISDIIKLLD